MSDGQSSPAFTINRINTPEAVAAAVPLVRQYWAFEAIDGFDAATVSQQLLGLVSAGERGAAWLAVMNGKAVGYVIVVYVFSLEHVGLTAEVDELFVCDDHRGRGIATALLQAVETASLDAGCRNLSLQLARSNARARAFYKRHGFTDRAQFELLEKTLQESNR